MAVDILTDYNANNLTAQDKPYEVFAGKCTGLLLRVEKTGKNIWWLYLYTPDSAEIRQRYRWKIGEFPTYHLFSRTPPKVEDRLRDVRSVAENLKAQSRLIDLREQKRQAVAAAKNERVARLGDFIDGPYLDYVNEHHRGNPVTTAHYLKAAFASLTDKRIDALTHLDIHRWMRTYAKTRAPATVKRRLTALSGVLSLALANGLINSHPLQAAQKNHPTTRIIIPEPEVKPPRFLSSDEATQLRAALKARDRKLKAQRERTIANYGARGKVPPASIIGPYADYLTPLVLLALNTGIRRGGLLGLDWSDIHSGQVFVRASLDKAAKGYSVPLSTEAEETLRLWKKQTSGTSLVFPHPQTEKKMHDIRSSWSGLMKLAGIRDFRFHDLRHSFASSLVMGGVPIYTVQRLLGHATMEMTMRYAHLAPEHLQEALAVLNA